MKLLVDEALQNAVALSLTEAGHDATHIRLLGLAGHTGDEVMALALREALACSRQRTRTSEPSWP